MNIKAKTTLIIIITLCIGIIIGALLNRALMQNRIRRTFSMRNPDVFVSSFERIINPDAKQRHSIMEILDKYADEISEYRTRSQEEILSLTESMKAELDQILTPKQKKRLERRFLGRPPFPNRSPMRADVNEELSMLKKELGLSEEQASKIKIILEEWRNQIRTMRGGYGEIGQMRQRREEIDKAIEKILNEDQKKIYNKIKKNRLRRMEKEMQKPPRRFREKNFPGF